MKRVYHKLKYGLIGLGIKNNPIKFASVTNASDIASTMLAMNKRNIVVIDSIQTMYLPQLDSAPGTVSQVRASTHELIIAAKKTNSILIFDWTCYERWNNCWTQSFGTHGRYGSIF